nr:uncharacterized protein LOC109172327 [Ipomoea batatas]
MKLAASVVEFGNVMNEVGSKQVGKDIVKKTFCKMSDMLCAASSSQPARDESLLDDDPIFNDENFLAAVAALEDAFTKTSNACPIFSPNWDLLTPTPNTQPDQEKTLMDKTLGKDVTCAMKYEESDKILRNAENVVDYGVYCMRHLETYKGVGPKWDSDFKRTSDDAIFLTSLRAKYASCILKLPINQEKETVLEKARKIYG